MLKITEDKDKIFYFEYRLKLGAYNVWNKEMENNKVFRTIVNFTEEEYDHLKDVNEKIYSLYK